MYAGLFMGRSGSRSLCFRPEGRGDGPSWPKTEGSLSTCSPHPDLEWPAGTSHKQDTWLNIEVATLYLPGSSVYALAYPSIGIRCERSSEIPPPALSTCFRVGMLVILQRSIDRLALPYQPRLCNGSIFADMTPTAQLVSGSQCRGGAVKHAFILRDKRLQERRLLIRPEEVAGGEEFCSDKSSYRVRICLAPYDASG